MAERYFVGDISRAWNDAGNWSASSGRPGGAGVPGAGDKAVLDGESPDCSADVNIAVLGLELTSEFGGTLGLATYDMAVGTGGFRQAGGTFNGGSGSITYNGDLSLSGGTHTTTSGTTTLKGKWKRTGGIFNDAGGKYRMECTFRPADLSEDFRSDTL